ncbi:serine hydrolase domain-containing protein [Chryseobacterium jejuense]|uniref:CubicO group peptidase, beta-lactamase class C family n=1 Tax=Chryseobacterium jejuense TaxID=445960 RepID=A0A2X2VHQ6_CHRJE|nr:serine hydrolase domain-containing protein [Chryseobacterium jejuense]SDJ12164.1 CubicO group peptidase, beta-lactamase class C family [Chryseobacterium jejuense]SQB27954.1 Penicillin-binding protein E [Chryseobacterium jejuense]
MTKTKLFFTLAISALLSVSAKAQKTPSYSKKIDSIMTTSTPLKFNGVVLVSQNGKIKYLKANGYKDFEKMTALKTNDQFEIMSNSKQVTAVLILQAAEQGKLDLQTPIKKYLPTITQSWADTVTIHNLLNHTHGIVDLEKPVAFKAGSQFKYGNLSYTLLGEILQNTTGESFTELATTLFKKLKMEKTFVYNSKNNQALVPGYRSEHNQFEKVEGSFLNDDIAPAAGIVSTVEDVAKWDQALFKGKLLSPKFQKLFLTPSTSSQHNVFGKESMGFGYNIRFIKEVGLNYYAVTGLGDGFTCLNVYFPSTDTSLIILENQMPRNSEHWSFQEAAIKNIILKSITSK